MAIMENRMQLFKFFKLFYNPAILLMCMSPKNEHKCVSFTIVTKRGSNPDIH